MHQSVHYCSAVALFPPAPALHSLQQDEVPQSLLLVHLLAELSGWCYLIFNMNQSIGPLQIQSLLILDHVAARHQLLGRHKVSHGFRRQELMVGVRSSECRRCTLVETEVLEGPSKDVVLVCPEVWH